MDNNSIDSSAVSRRVRKWFSPFLIGFALAALLGGSAFAQATNLIVAENLLTGSPPSQWQITDAGDSTIQGYATDISVTNGGTIYFKIKTTASAYTIQIYRLGYYQGNGARLVATVSPSAHLPQSQPAPITNSATGLLDYGNWAVSASWQVPTNAVSGVYIARLKRTDTSGASHIVFIVRNDSSTSDILFKTSDTTWQAYNAYGGNSLYTGGPAGRAYKVSYNRPFATANPTAGGASGNTEHDWLFNAEYPMIRWLEANGYNVSYTTGLDMDRQPGALLLNHHLITSLGHDEYWSGLQRTNFENALAAGVNLAFFSGNEVAWKIRWESSIDGSNTPYRTMVCYKESVANAKIDPSPTWTGYWRDPRFSPPADGGRPENRLSGTLSEVNDNGQSYTIQVPSQFSSLRFWRNTAIASLSPGSTGNLGSQTLGYEWDVSPDNGFRPPGLMYLSSTIVSNVPVLQGDRDDYETDNATHNLTLYRAPSGALVFGAGTCQWSWGLDTNHYDSYSSSTPPVSPAMQQATVNLFADMGIQPGTLQSGLVAATASTDVTPPTVVIQTPASGGTISLGTTNLIKGTASDVGGHVAAVEVSTDGGATWHAAAGMTNWTYTWTAKQAGSATIMCRATDDSGNLGSPVAGPTFTVVGNPGTLWPATAVPILTDSGPDSSAELGVKFYSDIPGRITGIRFYKASANTGTHVGSLWSNSGTKLASATFTGESASGWQQVNFSTPVSIASNTIYVASYHCPAGHASMDDWYFLPNGVDAPPLHAPSTTLAGMAGDLSVGNGVYVYSSSSTFPTNTYDAANFWVDVVFVSGLAPGLPVQTNQTINELTLLTVTNTAVNNDIPPLPLSYTLRVTNIVSHIAVTNAAIGTNGVITWVPQQTQSPGTNRFTTIVSDGSLSATNGFNVVVVEVNQAPMLPGQTNVTLSGTQSLVVTNTAGEPNIHSVTTGYSLAVTNVVTGQLVTNAAINANGVITWTPALGQVPSTNLFVTVVTNSNPYDVVHPGLKATNNFMVTVNAIHNGPGLPGQTNVVVNELTLLTVTNSAVDNDIPALLLSYSLTVTNLGNGQAVTNAVIDTNGVITWVPQQTQSPGTNRFTTIVSDGSLSATNGFNVVVVEVNQAPMLPGQTNVTLSGTQSLVVTNTAGEPNIHSVTTGYSLAVTNVVTGQLVTNAAINANGVITWTPALGQVPGTNVFMTVVTNSNPYDVVHPGLKATNNFMVTVNAIHNGPGLPGQTNVVVNELTLLTVTNSAVDNDIPALPLSYSLTVTNLGNGQAVTNAVIDTNGVITWVPQQTQSPGTNRFTTIVSDGSLSATNGFNVVVVEVNQAPMLPGQTNVTLSGTQSLVVTNTAGEPNIHSVTTGYSLAVTNVVTGQLVTNAAINANGVITWTPALGQVPSTNLFVTVVTNSNPYDVVHPSLKATNNFMVTVNAIHNGPGLPGQTNVVVNELTLLTVTNSAVDNDIPALPLSYSLTVTNLGNGQAVTNAVIDTNGVITWVPQQTQSPGTNRFTTVVTDGSLGTTNGFNVMVVEVNQAPMLPGQTNVTLSGTQSLVVTNTAGEPNIHSVTTGYSLAVTNVVTGQLVTNAAINANGVITWTPALGQVPSTNLFVTVVTNSNPYDVVHPSLKATNNFMVTVNAIHNGPGLPGQTNVVVNELTLLTVTNSAVDNDIPALPLSYSLTVTNLGNGQAVTNAVIDTNGVITWVPQQTQSPGTNRFTTVVTDGSLGTTNGFNVVVVEVNQAPMLPGQTNVTLSGTQSLVVTNTAGEPNIHSVTTGYSLAVTNVVTGQLVTNAAINANGVITWTPALGQVPSTNLFVTVVTNSNPYDVVHPSLKATNNFMVTVNAIHNGPGLPGQTNVVVNELTLLTVTNSAVDNDIPALPLSYSLTVTNLGNGQAVTNAVIDTNGVITWVPQQTQSPGTNRFTTVVTDGSLGTTNGFNVMVVEVNQAPMLPGQTNVTLSGTQSLVVTNTAGEPNIHSVTTGYGLLVTNVVTGQLVTNAAINANGVITWTPALGQVPGTNVFMTVVTNSNPYDVVHPGLKATNNFMVTVNAIHNGPGLPGQTNVVVNELTLLTVTNSAVDNDIPALPLSYSLTVTNLGNGQAVTNAAIDTNGVIMWMPQQEQSPGTNRFTTVVTDGSLGTTNGFNVVVVEENVAPVLPSQPDLMISGLTAVLVTNTAGEPNIHSVTAGYGLLTAPAGASVDANGLIAWMPTVSQVPSTNTFTTVVTNYNPYDLVQPSLLTTNGFVVTVQAVHNGPVLPLQTNVVVNELTLLTVTNTASDTDIPMLPLSYSLAVTNLGTGLAVTNAMIDTNGVITWTPDEAQGPGTNLFTTVVSDGSLSATNDFLVMVNEVNMAPVLPAQTNQIIDVFTQLIVTNTATDNDIPASMLNYMLAAAPNNALIDANGVITWTPLSAYGGTTNQFITVATDDGLPPLSATNSFEIIVNPAPVIPTPVIQAITVSDDVVTVSWSSVSNAVYRLQCCEQLWGTNWTDLTPDVQAAGPTATATNAVSDPTQQFYRVMVVPWP